MRSNRKLNTLIIKPKQQFQIALYFAACFFVLIGSIIWYFISSVNKTLKFVTSTYQVDPELLIYFDSYLNSSIYIAASMLLIITIIALLLWIKLSHRIFGPLVPISKHVTELKNGNYASRIQLRKDDFMLELKDELNELAEKLQAEKS